MISKGRWAAKAAGVPRWNRSDSVVIVDGLVADSPMGSLEQQDILLHDGRIVEVSRPGGISLEGKVVVDAAADVVAPGFIDVHSHADNAPLLEVGDATKVKQGVTTEIVGNCGFSLAPSGKNSDSLEELLGRIFPPLDAKWRDFQRLFETLDKHGYVTNYVPLVGHNALRLAAAGNVNRALRHHEEAMMQRLLSQALDSGVFGLSSGLIYPPGMYAPPDELAGLVRMLPAGRVYATHMRNEGRRLLDSVEETIATARGSECRVEVSHLKSSGRRNWGGVDRALDRLDRAREEGCAIGQDAYPYVASSTMLAACLPPWFLEGGAGAVMGRLGSAKDLERAQREIESGPMDNWENHVWSAGWAQVVVSSTRSHRWEGESLAAIGQEMGGSPFEALVEVLQQESLKATMVVWTMSDADVANVLRHRATMIGSDGLPPGGGGRPHPRLFGTFPHFLGKFVRDQGAIPLSEALSRVAAMPANHFGIRDRGFVKRGYVADLVLFNLSAIGHPPDYRTPDRDPTGIDAVLIGGEPAVWGGEWLGRRLGERLLPG